MLLMRLVAVSVAFIGLSALQGQVSAAEIESPQVGDPVVVYTHKFKPKDFEAGAKLVIDGFSEAMTEHGADRLTFFLVDRDANEVVAVSVFKNGASADKWHDAMARHDVLEELVPLRRQPLILQEFQLESVHVVDP